MVEYKEVGGDSVESTPEPQEKEVVESQIGNAVEPRKEEIVEGPVDNLSEIKIPEEYKERPRLSPGPAQRIVAKSREEGESTVLEEKKIPQGESGQIREDEPTLENKPAGKGFQKVLVIGAIFVALIIIAGGFYFMLRSLESNEDLVFNESKFNGGMINLNNSKALGEDKAEVNYTDPKDFTFRIISAKCSKESVNVTARLTKGNLDGVVFDVKFGNESLRLLDDAPISQGQTKVFEILLSEVDEDPWSVDIRGVKGPLEYDVMDTKRC